MPEMAKYQMEQEMGCGIMGRIFRRRSFQNHKISMHSLPSKNNNNVFKIQGDVKKAPKDYSKTGQNKREKAFLEAFKLAKHVQKVDQDNSKSISLALPGPPPTSQQKLGGQKRDNTSDSKEVIPVVSRNNHPLPNERKDLVRSTSSNVMLRSQLGNLRHQGNGNVIGNNSPNSTVKTEDYLQRSIQETNSILRPRNGYSKLGGNFVMGNIVRQPSGKFRQGQGLITRMDPEALKNLGNHKYKQGKFKEALALYDQAIALDSGKATFWCNRSAALIGLGRILDAVFECKEAIKLDPSYQRAHHRLATLYIRLGEPEKALYHYKDSGRNATPEHIPQAKALQRHLKRCIEARRLKEWNTLLKETELAISSGADSAPQVYAMQAEALLRLHRHQEAYSAYQKGPNFGVECCSKFFGPVGTSHLLTIEAQVHLAAGGFDEAVVVAQQAARLNPSNREANVILKSVKAVSAARKNGNMLFKELKFYEACMIYSEGLEFDPYNSVLLCNRAACRIKLGQFEKAVEDCTRALSVQPNYIKARLRRADCYAKMEKWEAAVQDYELLARGSPNDEAARLALFEAQAQIKKKHDENLQHMARRREAKPMRN